MKYRKLVTYEGYKKNNKETKKRLTLKVIATSMKTYAGKEET